MTDPADTIRPQSDAPLVVTAADLELPHHRELADGTVVWRDGDTTHVLYKPANATITFGVTGAPDV